MSATRTALAPTALAAFSALSASALLLPEAVAAPTVPAAGDEIAAPPGLVMVEGGKTTIGSDEDDIKDLIVRTNIRKLVGETPQGSVKVDDFYLMVSEVTNEQYLAFVEATGAKPPQSWGTEAIDAAIRPWLEEQQRLREEALARGDEFERKTFDRKAWWDENWQSAEYQLPSGREAHPVEYVDYAMVEAYARWAGLRLMSEYEYQRACRGKTENRFIWGDTFEYGHAATREANRDDSWPVGSFAQGATEQGIHDLIGNVWEWTSSPYLPYEDYEPLEVRFDARRTEICITEFDGGQRVVVGGSYANDQLAARITTRRATDRSQATEAMGFRCAATPTPGLDLANTILQLDVPSSLLPEGMRLLTERVIGMDRWQTEDGTAGIDGYRIITDYDSFLFIPMEQIPATSEKDLAKHTQTDGPVPLGVLSVTMELTEPALEPGVYLLAWRGEGEARTRPSDDEEGEEGAAVEEEEPIWSTEKEQFVFYAMDGTPLLAVDSTDLPYERLKPGSVVHRTVVPNERQAEAGAVAHDEVRLTVPLPGKASQKGFTLDLRLQLAENALGDGWRRSGD